MVGRFVGSNQISELFFPLEIFYQKPREFLSSHQTPHNRVKRLDPQKKIILPWKKKIRRTVEKKLFCPEKKILQTQNVEGDALQSPQKKIITQDAHMRPVRAMLLEHTCLLGAHAGACHVLATLSASHSGPPCVWHSRR